MLPGSKSTVCVEKPKLIFIQACRKKAPEAAKPNHQEEDNTFNKDPLSASQEGKNSEVLNQEESRKKAPEAAKLIHREEDRTFNEYPLPTSPEGKNSAEVLNPEESPASPEATHLKPFPNNERHTVPETSQDNTDGIKEADLLTFYSCCENYGSWRDTERGSLFIQAIAKKFEEKADRMDVLSMLTEVNNDVAKKSKSLNMPIQICEIVSRLRRKLYFLPATKTL